MSIERHRCVQLPCPECGMDFKAWADANRVEGIENQNRVMREALLRIACMDMGEHVTDTFDEPNSAQVAREALAHGFVGPCMHGRDPWDRCDEVECMDEESAWTHAFISRGEVPHG